MDSASPSPPSPCPPPSHVTTDPTANDLEPPVRATAFTLHADDLGIETRSGVSYMSGLGVRVLDQEARSSSTGSPFSKMEPLQSAPLALREEMAGSPCSPADAQRDAIPETCLLAVQKLPPLDEAMESENGCDNTSLKMVDDDVTAMKQLAQQAPVPDRRQEAPAEDRQTQHRDETSVSLWPAEEASGCSTSWQDELEAARLAAYPPHRNPQPLPPGKSFHVFFSYCWRDEAWVRRMVDVLEKEHGLRCCYHERDFKPGARIIENINLHIESSMKTALVVSPAFLESEWCSYEAEVVMHLSVEQRRRLLVPVLLQQCQLPGALRPLTYIDATVPAFLDRFMAAIFDQDDSVHDRPLPFGRTDFFFNPNFYNLDHLCDVTSKWTCLRGETILSPYVPEVLTNRGLTMTPNEHREIMATLMKASSILCSGLCDNCCAFSVVFACLAAGCLTLSSLIVASLLAGSSASVATSVAILCVSVILPLVVLLSFCVITFRKQRRLRKSMTEVNRIYFRHQLIAGILINLGTCRRPALQLKVHYFNPRPCLDHLARLLPSPPSPSTQGSEGTDDQLLDAGTSLQINQGERSLLGGGQSSTIASDQIEGDDVALLNPCTETGETEESSPEQSRALELLLKYSGDYMRDYIEGKLPVCEPSRHVRQVSCLCQYVEDRIAVV